MLSQLTIPNKKNRQARQDHPQLYAIGLKYIQQLSSQIWTDYNIHDPGITTLELLCYALTELNYRASFPIADLFASETNNAEAMKQQFFTARQILPNRALTLLDYRKLLIDLKYVKNAWLRPALQTYFADTVAGNLLRDRPTRPGIVEVNLAGLYAVTIEYENGISAATKQKTKQFVEQTLQANRNLCEDFVAFDEIQQQQFLLCAELELAPNADVTTVRNEVFSQIQNYLTPSVRFYTLDEMLTRSNPPYTVDEIFDGPALDHGFIDDAELTQAELRSEIRLSDIISIIMDIQGVQAVRDIVVNPQGQNLANKWMIPVESNKQAILDRQQSRLVFYKRNMPVVPSSTLEVASTAIATPSENDLPIPLGTYRKLDRYYSFQNHFPAVYGLSDTGLNSTASDQRKALSYQLKAYLLFFDQVMANYFAQLSHVKELFSTDPALHHTYFCQVVDSFTEYDRIYATADGIGVLQTQSDAAEKSSKLDRRNRFLDHLIAQFAERFHDYAYTMYSVFGTSPERIIADKCDFLKNYPTISGSRSLAYNYQLSQESDLWNTDNVSGFEKRVAKLLGIQNEKRRNLSEIAYDIYAEVDGNPTDEFRFRIRNRDTSKILLSSSQNYATQELARTEMERAIQFASMPTGYDRKKTSDNRYYFNIIDQTGAVIARRIDYFNTESELDQAIDEVIQYLQMNYSDEGMYVIEHILLRPEATTDPFMPICPTPDCMDCAEADPYSYRISIILPSYSNRFRTMEFRQFVEQLIREETPAHILPKICWINKDDMAALEKLYRDWIYLKAGAEKTQRSTKLQNFINWLFNVKNVYPPRNLYDCDATEDKPKFILGQSTLGTGTDIES